MIFVGDIALGKKKIQLKIPDTFFKNKIIANLEGGIIQNVKMEKKCVYNSDENTELLSKFYLFCLANNHLLDPGNVLSTIEYLNKLNIPFTGLLKKGEKPFFQDNKFIYLNFGWSVIEARGKNSGYKINPLNKKHVLKTVSSALKEKTDKKIICIFHWGYELELYPQPLHRELSHWLIDMGVELIIGHHSHRVQGIEIYKGKPIVYGLGNFLFAQNYFINKRLNFPDFCSEQIAFEYKDNSDFIIHWFNYNKEKSSLEYKTAEKLTESKRIKDLSPFNKMNSIEYKKWFKNNRVQKKLLPIYYMEDSLLLKLTKNFWVFIRQFLITVLVKFHLKGWK